MLDAPESMLAERRRLGLDVFDEMWDGLLHMVPPPGGPHQNFGAKLLVVLSPLAQHAGLEPHYEAGLFRSTKDYRVPDQLYCRPEDRSDRGAEGAELVVEIRAPGDQTYDKIDFYAELGVREMLIVHPLEQRVELLRLVDSRLLLVTSEGTGAVRSDVLGASFATVESALRISWGDGSADI